MGLLSESGSKGTLSFAIGSLRPRPQPQLHPGSNHQEVSHQDKEAGGGPGGGPSMGSQARELGAHSQEGETVRWPAKVLFLSQPLMAKLCGPRRGGPQTGGSRRQRVPRGRQKVPRGQGEESDVLLPQGRVLPLVRSWGDPESRSCSSLADKELIKGRATWSPSKWGLPRGEEGHREKGAISSLGLEAKTRGSLGYRCSSFFSTPPPPQ